MSVRVMSWVWRQSRSRGTARLVLLAIADCANDHGADAYPSTGTLVEKTGLSERGVRKAVADLSTLGELEVAYKAGPKGCNRYRVLMVDPSSDAENLASGTGSYSTRHDVHGAPRAESTRHDVPGTRHETTVDPARGAPKPSENHPPTEPSNEPSRSRRSPRPRRDPASDRPDVDRICRHLVARMVANGCKPPTITKAWRDAARLMLDVDGRELEKIIKAIDWCQDDEFWRANIKSVPKLREQYDTLRLQAMRANGARGSPHRAYRNPTDDRAYTEGL